MKYRLILFIAVGLLTNSALAQSPKKRLKIAQKHYEQRSWKEAYLTLNKGEETGKWQNDILLLKAKALVKMQQLHRAAITFDSLDAKAVRKTAPVDIVQFEQELKLLKANYLASLYMGLEQLEHSNYDSAQVEANEMLALDTLKGEGYYLQGRLSKGYAEEQLNAYQKAINKGFDTVGLSYEYGKLAYELTYYDRAEEALKNALKKKEEETASLKLLAELLYRKREYASADEYLNQLFYNTPKSVDKEVYMLSGGVKSALGEYVQSATMYGKALALDSSDFDPAYQRAMALKKAGQFQNALTELLWVSNQFPEQGLSDLALAEIYLDQENGEEALKALLAADQKLDTYPSETYYYGKAFLYSENYTDALEKFNALQERQPLDYPIVVARCYVGLNEHQKALEVLNEAIKKGTVYAPIYAYAASLKKAQQQDYQEEWKKAQQYGWRKELPVLP